MKEERHKKKNILASDYKTQFLIGRDAKGLYGSTSLPSNRVVWPVPRAGNRAGWAKLGQANSGLDQNRTGSKLVQIFRTKFLIAQPALKTGLVGPNGLLKEKKIRPDRVGPY